MSVNIGSTNIERIYLGSTEIAEVYLGSTKVFGQSQPPTMTYYKYATGNASADSNLFNAYGSSGGVYASGMVYRSSATASTTASTNITITSVTWPGSTGSPTFASSSRWSTWQSTTMLSTTDFNGSNVRFGIFYLPNTSTMSVGGSSSNKRWRSTKAPTLMALGVLYGAGSYWGGRSFTPPTGTYTLPTPVSIPVSSVLFMCGYVYFNGKYYFPRGTKDTTELYTSDNDLVLHYT